MKRCISACFHVFPLLTITAGVNLRHVPGVTAGIGSLDDTSDKAQPNLAQHESQPEYTLTLENYKGVQYYAPISLNNQKMSAVYDTGSFEIMAMSKQCAACRVPASQVKYDNMSSATFVKSGHPIENHHFAGGLVVAKQAFETVHIGDLGKDFTVKDMPFQQVVHTEMLVWMNNAARFTAIVGLGHRTIVPDTPADQKPMESLLERTNTHRFAICLEKGASNPGHITFNPRMQSSSPHLQPDGTGDASTSVFRRVPVIGKNHWAVKLNQVTTSNRDTACTEGEPCIAIIDSGTSLLGVPPMGVPMIAKLVKQIKQDCSNLNELDDLTFDLAGHKFVLPPSAYVVKFPSGNTVKCLPAFTDFDMMSSQGAVWILGMPFLRHFYTVFDRTEPSIYVAEQGSGCQPAVNNATATFVNASFNARRYQEPAIADTTEAMLPSWASNHSTIEA